MNDRSGRTDGTDWWDEEKVAVQLQEAVAILDRHYIQQPVQRDFVAHAENVSAWIAMTSAHSLVEQSLKAVLRKRGRAEAEQRGAAGHDLSTLYDALPDGDKLAVERELLAFAVRYGGMPWRGVAGFLSNVAHDYEGWRYLLTELPQRDLSTTHPEALLAIAKGLVRGLVESAIRTASGSPRSSKPDERSERTVAAQSGGTMAVDAKRQKQWRKEAFLVDGLNTASERLKLHLGENYRLVDSIDPDQQQSASAWMAITCGYSLLEQSIKALLHRRSHPWAERRGHDIDKLYKRLPEADKAFIEQGFAVYASLFDEIADSSASEFLRRVGRAYNDWRYLLVERPHKQLSAIHPGALLEVAGLVVEILVNETFTDHGMHHVARRLHDRIRMAGINEAQLERKLERHEQGLTQEAMTPLADWLREVPNLLTGYAAYLGGEIPESELVADLLKRAEKRLDHAAARPGGLDLHRFMQRAREQDSPLIWDSAKGIFAQG